MVLLSLTRAIRHAPLLERAAWLWDPVRPRFDATLRTLYSRGGLTVRIGNGERIRVDPACRDYQWDSDLAREDALWTALMDELQPGDRLADVGAHIGVYTIAAARRGAVVTSYEPNPQTAALLRRNIRLNGVSDRVTVEEAAVAASSESLRLVPGGTLNIASHIDPGGTPVRATTLTGPFDLVKIDVEGYEFEVLQGAAPMFAGDDRPRAVFVELHKPVHSRALAELLPGYNAERVSVTAHAATEHWVARFRGTQDPAHRPS